VNPFRVICHLLHGYIYFDVGHVLDHLFWDIGQHRLSASGRGSMVGKREAEEGVQNANSDREKKPGCSRKRSASREVHMRTLRKDFHRIFFTKKTNLGVGDEDRFREHHSQSTYGYLTFEGVDDMLSTVETQGKVFYDLGSGVGKPPVAALMLFPELKRSMGIELSIGRHEQALMAVKEIKDKKAREKLSFIHGSMLEEPLDDADLVYISSLCFSNDFLRRLGKHLDSRLREGTIVLSSKAVPLKRAELVGRPVVAMSWNNTHQLHKYKITKPLSPMESPIVDGAGTDA